MVCFHDSCFKDFTDVRATLSHTKNCLIQHQYQKKSTERGARDHAGQRDTAGHPRARTAEIENKERDGGGDEGGGDEVGGEGSGGGGGE